MINTPQNQKLLTNVCVVRLKKGGKRFEVACYPNTVVAWRSGAQKDLSEVLQCTAVFADVAKGINARRSDVVAAFGTADTDAVVREILANGELQVGDMERKAMLDATFKDIATIVAAKCVNPRTQRPIPVTMVEKAMRDVLHYSVVPRKSPKQQALDVIRLLKERGFPIARAPMAVRAVAPAECAPALLEVLRPLCIRVAEAVPAAPASAPDNEPQRAGGVVLVEALLEPSKYRECEAAVKECTGGRGRVDVQTVSQQPSGDTYI